MTTPTGTPPAAITPQGVRDGDPAVLAALAARRGPAVVAFAEQVCDASYVVRASADAFARFRAAVAAPDADVSAHPDALLLRCARRAALDLAPIGPDLGCGPAAELLTGRAERTIKPRDAGLLNRHLEACDHCRALADSLDAADRAYRDADETPLPAESLAAIVAALAASAPIRPAEPIVLPEGRMAILVQEDPEPEPEPAAEREVEPEPEAEVDEESEVPIGTRRVTGAPTPYYEVPSPQPRERGRRAKRVAAAGAAMAQRAQDAARKRRQERVVAGAEIAPEPEPVAEDTVVIPVVEPQPEPVVLEQPAEEFEAVVLPADPELEQESARAAARHYRRLRHRLQREQTVPADGRPPRLERPWRDRGPHIPLSDHGPRHLALPAGLVVLAALVIMAVSGVFGGGTETPATGTSTSAPPEVALVSQSATSISLNDAELIAARAARKPAP